MNKAEWAGRLSEIVGPTVGTSERVWLEGFPAPDPSGFRFRAAHLEVDPLNGQVDLSPVTATPQDALQAARQMVMRATQLRQETARVAEEFAGRAERARLFKSAASKEAQAWARRLALVDDFVASGRLLVSSASGGRSLDVDTFQKGTRRLLGCYDSFVAA
ncbi:hypothetical protein GCM10022399_42340 [Terrabacter ginsenosidimutans]|uniref:Uncharacterized protein n=1 Tax=Terrabacter ginsenosidimutans TaxID=490575 RepID=A0ABP7EN66_9MICO